MPSDSDPPLPSPVPLHAVSVDGDKVLKIHRRPGRPRRVQPAPDADERDYVAAVNEARREHVAADDLVRAMQANESREVIAQAELGLAVEAASLLFEIERGQSRGTDVAQIHSRRIDALVKLGSVVLARQKVFAGEFEEDMPKITAFFIETVSKVLRQTLDPARAEAITAEIRRRLEGGANRLGDF